MSEYTRRWQNLCEMVSESQNQRFDFIAITGLPNLRYFFNYGGQSFERFCCGLLSPNGSRGALVVPKLDLGKTKNSIADAFGWSDNEGYKDSLVRAMKSIRAKSDRPIIACEPGLTVYQMQQFKAALPIKEFKPIGEEISKLRLHKSAGEIDFFRDSARRLVRAYETFPEIIRAGKTESEVGYEIMKIMSEIGLNVTEPPLVQSGENSAIPHSTPSKRKIRAGDMIVVDSSAPNRDGYFADYTRTYVMGRATLKQKQAYETVKRAQAAGVAISKLGATTGEVDRAARSAIETEGYGEYFIHRTGHGLGLEVHEAPYLMDGGATKLEPGMIFTIEPGIYLPGKFGVRIEDNLVLSESKTENVTRLSHELTEL